MEMTKPKRRCWAIRTDKNNESLLFDELRNGRLRQGWGHDPNQDLRLIQGEIASGGNWWERLSTMQKEVFPHLRMISSAEDSVQLGDLILVPNLPEQGYFVLGEVTGTYYYDPLMLSKEQDINELGKDYGHVLPVRLLTERGINKYAGGVEASIRSTLRTPMRMWNLDAYGEALETLVTQYGNGADLSTALSGEARLDRAWEAAWSHATEALRQRLEEELKARFQAAEWEEPITRALKGLYPGAQVRPMGGPGEHGADVVIQIPNHFGGSPWLILIQVKNYIGQIDAAVVTQLRSAYTHYAKEGTPLSLVVMTTANEASTDLRTAASALSKELGIPVQVVLRREMIEIMSEGLRKGLDPGRISP